MKKRAVRLHYGDLFQGWELTVARSAAHSFWRANAGLQEAFDREDLVQECLIKWFATRDSYAEERGASPKTFMNIVVRNHLQGLARKADTDRRRINAEAVLFSHPIDDDRTVGDEVASQGDEPGLSRTLAEAIEDLSPRERQIIALLGAGHPKTAIATALKVHRSTVVEDLKRIRKAFEHKGLKEYLE